MAATLLLAAPVWSGTVEIAKGVFMPQVNLGTWSLGNGEPSDPSVGVPPWISAGGVGLDCAWDYFNQASVAKAIASTGKNRAELFITTKVPGTGNALSILKTDLKQLNVDYVDLVLLHAPRNVEGQWKDLEQALALNLTRSIGVSNFNADDLAALLKYATVVPAVNQCQMGIAHHDDAAIAFGQQHGITYEAWGVMKNCQFNDTTITRIARTHNATAAQVCIRYILDRNCTAAVGTGSTASTAVAYAKEDLATYKFKLTSAEVAELTAISSGYGHTPTRAEGAELK